MAISILEDIHSSQRIQADLMAFAPFVREEATELDGAAHGLRSSLWGPLVPPPFLQTAF